MEAKVITTRTGTFCFGDDGILRITLFEIEESIDDAQRTVATVSTMAAGTLPPILVDMYIARWLTRDVRNYYMELKGTPMASAAALLVRSPLSRMIGNIFTAAFAKSGMPLRLFTSEEDAITWLKGFMNE